MYFTVSSEVVNHNNERDRSESGALRHTATESSMMKPGYLLLHVDAGERGMMPLMRMHSANAYALCIVTHFYELTISANTINIYFDKPVQFLVHLLHIMHILKNNLFSLTLIFAALNTLMPFYKGHGISNVMLCNYMHI